MVCSAKRIFFVGLVSQSRGFVLYTLSLSMSATLLRLTLLSVAVSALRLRPVQGSPRRDEEGRLGMLTTGVVLISL